VVGGDVGPLAGAFRSLRLAGQHIKERPGAGGKTLRVPSVPSASLAPCLKHLPVEARKGPPSRFVEDEG